MIKRLMAAPASDQKKPPPNRAAASNRKNTPAPDPAAGALVRGADYYRQDR